MKRKVPKEIAGKARQITGKRAKLVVGHILKHGSITTEDLEKYGYKHPPRAVRDVVEQGLPLERFWTQSGDGRKIAGYRFGDPKHVRHDRLGGRKFFSKEFVAQVIQAHESRCAICRDHLEKRYLQIDHRVPYQVAGDIAPEKRNIAEYMPLCGSCNRAKSWSCEHCRNWIELKEPSICHSCYWASPGRYSHVAMREIRRLDIVWQETEVGEFEALAKAADTIEESMPNYVKKVLRQHLRGNETK